MSEDKKKELKIDDLENVAGGLISGERCPTCGYIYNMYSAGCGRCNPDLYRCQYCGQSFFDDDARSRHIQENHLDIILQQLSKL